MSLSFLRSVIIAKDKKEEKNRKTIQWYAGAHLILQCGKLLQNVAQLVPLSCAVVTMDLYQTAERLQGEQTSRQLRLRLHQS